MAPKMTRLKESREEPHGPRTPLDDPRMNGLYCLQLQHFNFFFIVYTCKERTLQVDGKLRECLKQTQVRI